MGMPGIRRLVVTVAIASLLATAARAQVIDHCVANADVVVLGRIVDVAADDQDVGVEVIETFKGPARPHWRVALLGLPGKGRLGRAKEVFIFAALAGPAGDALRETHGFVDVREAFSDSRFRDIKGARR